MKKIIKLLPVFLLLTGCSNTPKEDKKPEEKPDRDIVYNYADVFIFMGQSNMAGRGEAEDALPCLDHGYEYRAVSGTPGNEFVDLTEPFGKNENNAQMSDGNNGDGKKSGSMVSSFIEGYYEVTKVPVVGVSASVGGTSITSWKDGSTYLEESIRRLKSCIDFFTTTPVFTIRNINMVWCQGCSDATKYVSQQLDYFGMLDGIVSKMQSIGDKYNIKKCVIIPPSIYGSGTVNENKKTLADDQITYCSSHSENYFLGSKKFYNVPASMRDDPHFHQGIYNVTGYDAGKHTGEMIEGKTISPYEEFQPGEEVTLATKYGISLKYHC